MGSGGATGTEAPVALPEGRSVDDGLPLRSSVPERDRSSLASIAGRSRRRHAHVLGLRPVTGAAVLVDVDALELAGLRDAELVHRLDAVHQEQTGAQGDDGDRDAADELGDQLTGAASVEEALDLGRGVGTFRTGEAVAAGEQAEAQGAPDPAEAVDRNGTDRIVDPHVLDEVDAPDADQGGDAPDED